MRWLHGWVMLEEKTILMRVTIYCICIFWTLCLRSHPILLSSSRSRLSYFCFLSKSFLLLPWWMLCMPRKQILMDFPSKQVQEARMRSITSWLQHTSGAYMDLRYSVLSLRGDIFASGVGGERPSMRIAEGRNLKRIPLHILCLHANCCLIWR